MVPVFRTLRFATRRLVSAPVFAITAVLTLGLGIGAVSAVFSVIQAVLLRPLPYPGADRLVDLGHTLEIAGVTRVDQSDASYLFYRRENRVFSEVGAYQRRAVNLGGIQAGADTDRADAARVSASLFPTLGATPRLGRIVTERDDQPGAAPVVVLSERLWKAKFGADPALIGRSVPVDGVPHLVVGVMPESFRFPDAGIGLWLPSGIDPAKTESATFGFRAVARMKPGVTLAAANQDLNRLLVRLPEAFPGRLTEAAITATRMRAVARPLRDVVVGDIGRALWVALGAVGCVLLAACGNLANLFLVRAEARSREALVRRALGEGRAAALAEALGEGVVVAMVGGAIGIVLAGLGVSAFQALSPRAGWGELPRLAEVRLDGSAVAFAIGLTALTALLVSLVPAVRALVAPPQLVVGSDRTITAGRNRHLARYALVVSQVALALILLAGAGVMARSFARLREVPAGFDPSGVLTLRVALPDVDYPTSDAAARFHARALEAFAALPGIRAAGAATRLPLVPAGRQDTAVFIEDRPLRMGAIPGIHQVVAVSPDYFAAMGIPLVAGRRFERPVPGRPALEVMVSRAFAARYWPGEEAVGRRIRTAPTSPWSTIVGVAGDVRYSALEQPADEIVYVPIVAAVGMAGATWTPREVAFALRGAAGRDQAIQAEQAREVIRGLDPSVAVHAMTPMSEVMAGARARTAVTLLLLGVAALAGLALAAVGIFGVIAYGVSLRRREIGIRLALGARPAGVRRMVARQAVAVAAIGIVAGLAGALALTRVLGALLFETSPLDPAALGGAVLVLLAAAFVAGWAPAGRAARLDPAAALRVE